jgi:hypothetical protein
MVTLKAIARARSVSIAYRIATMRNLYSVCCSPVEAREYRAARFVVVMAESMRCRGASSMAACQRERQLQRVWRPRLPLVATFPIRPLRSTPVVVVQPAENGNGLDATVHLPRARDGLLLGERLVRARLVVEAREFDDEMSQVLLTKDKDVIEKLAS